MPVLELRPHEDCAFDHVSLGEVMLRLDPGDMRVRTARVFRAREGGGEYNVARGLRRCLGLRAAIVTALADNAVGRLVGDLMLQGGVDASQVRRVLYDGLGRTVRNGLNFTERGCGIRAAHGVSDRGHTAASQLKPGDIDWEYPLRHARRPVVPHRRHLRRPVRDATGGRRRGHDRSPAARYHRAAVDYGAAHEALAMTTPGDTSMASLAGVEALMTGAGSRVQCLWPGWAYAHSRRRPAYLTLDPAQPR